MRKSLKTTEQSTESQAGMALISAIFVILIASVIGFALYYSSIIAFTIAINERDNTEAFYIADAGINHAVALLSKVPKSQYSAVLKAGANTAPGTGDELSVPPSSGLWTSSQSIPAGNATGGGVTNFGAADGGRYWVSVKNDTASGETATADSNGILIVTSTGHGRDGATATIEVTTNIKNASPAVLINNNVRIRGNVSVMGTNGILHSNGTVDLGGSPCASLFFSTTSKYIGKTNCPSAWYNLANQPIIAPPIYNIRNDFFDKSDYILGAADVRAGKVYNNLGVMIYDTSLTKGEWEVGDSKWKWNAGSMTWSHSGKSILPGTFYSEGNMEVRGSYGSSAIPARVTFIAEGYIEFRDKPYISPDYSNYYLVAGTDVVVHGDLHSGTGATEGIIYALHQVDFVGSPEVDGAVISAGQADTNSPGCGCNPVALDNGFIKITGSPLVTSNGGLFGGGVSIINWREVRY